MHAAAVLRIAPNFVKAPEENVFSLDPASIAVLARAVLETYLVFFYLCSDPVSEDERALRLAVWDYHDIKSRLKGRKRTDPDDSEIPQFELLVAQSLEKVKAHEGFHSLPKDTRHNVKRGRDSMLLTNESVAKRAGIHPSRYWYDYVHLSSFTHAGPMALERLRDYHVQPDHIIYVMNEGIKTVAHYLMLGYLDFEKVCAPVPDLPSPPIRTLMLKWREIVARPMSS